MKIFIESPGDHSVGIPPEQAVVEMDVWQEEREHVRDVLTQAFSKIFGCYDPYVIFEDEYQPPVLAGNHCKRQETHEQPEIGS